MDKLERRLRCIEVVSAVAFGVGGICFAVAGLRLTSTANEMQRIQADVARGGFASVEVLFGL
jgi:hypothetical protein